MVRILADQAAIASGRKSLRAHVRPFWKAVLGYTDEPGADGPKDPIVDPVGQSPTIWFQ